MQLSGQAGAGAKDAQDQDWTHTLESVIENLDLMNHSTEQYFLKIGEKLAGFIDAVNLISSDLIALGDLISGEQGIRASQALTCALDRSVEMGARSEAGNSVLSSLRQETHRLKQTLTGFKTTVSSFRLLGVMTRIETARLGDASSEFGNLADDVKSLTAVVQARVANALDTASSLIPPIESALQNAQDLPAVISKVMASLSTFRDLQEKAHASAVRLGIQYAPISDAFKRLIVSMQFHDITRQQIEHVIDMLRHLCSEPEEDSLEDDRGKTAAILRLQSSQLGDAARKFAASVASIAQSLDEIATHVLEMVNESRTLSGLSADEKDSFFLQMEQGCSAILASLGRCTKAEAATKVTGGSLAETIDRMRAPVEEIRAIEVQIKRIRMNARIQAAQTGPAGDALGVLAGSIQQLALESQRRSESLIDALGAMSEAAGRLSKASQPAAANKGGGRDDYLDGMREAVAQLHSSTERSFAQIVQIITCGTRLRDDLSTTRQGFSAGDLFTETIGRAQAALKQIQRTNQDTLSGDVRIGLADFASHYTMQAERDVHDHITKAALGVAQSPVQSRHSEFQPTKAQEPADNVEFFQVKILCRVEKFDRSLRS